MDGFVFIYHQRSYAHNEISISITFLFYCLSDDNFQYDDTSIPKCDDSSSGFCEGGILTIDGINGNTIWQTWTAFNVFSLYCSEDLNGDTYNDCVASGRGGVSCDYKLISIF